MYVITRTPPALMHPSMIQKSGHGRRQLLLHGRACSASTKLDTSDCNQYDRGSLPSKIQINFAAGRRNWLLMLPFPVMPTISHGTPVRPKPKLHAQRLLKFQNITPPYHLPTCSQVPHHQEPAPLLQCLRLHRDRSSSQRQLQRWQRAQDQHLSAA